MPDEPQLILCPYCGHTQTQGDRCTECGGLFEPLSRKATQITMGPWYVRDRKRPYHPGCSYEVMKKRIAAGSVKPNSIVRGPTTHQYWSLARNTPGIAHRVGYCHECRGHVKPEDTQCPHCGVAFTEPNERDQLGLHYPTEQRVAQARKSLNAELEKLQAQQTTPPSDEPQTPPHEPTSATPVMPAGASPMEMADNLLQQVMGDFQNGNAEAETPGSHAANAVVGKERSAEPRTTKPAPTKAERRSTPTSKEASLDPFPVPKLSASPSASTTTDFSAAASPGEKAQLQTEQPTTPRGSNNTVLIAVLIAINAVALIAVLILVVMMSSNNGATPTTGGYPEYPLPESATLQPQPDQAVPSEQFPKQPEPELQMPEPLLNLPLQPQPTAPTEPVEPAVPVQGTAPAVPEPTPTAQPAPSKPAEDPDAEKRQRVEDFFDE